MIELSEAEYETIYGLHFMWRQLTEPTCLINSGTYPSFARRTFQLFLNYGNFNHGGSLLKLDA